MTEQLEADIRPQAGTVPPGAPKSLPPQSRPRSEPLGVVAGAFALLRALGQAPEPLGVTALASAVGIPKTTAHRLLEQMAAEGVVERRDRKWRLGPGVYDLARRGLSGAPSAGLGAAARHRLEALSKATGATLFLHRYSRRTLETVCHASGVRVTHHVTADEQDMAARHPASAPLAGAGKRAALGRVRRGPARVQLHRSALPRLRGRHRRAVPRAAEGG
ncbi:helix-turn-helix domain-containing protein [Streptomyces althioticus]|uniref:helix-turn-helix domain-containing protein n=1 Tax=Streptomyces althioticus TaxID=83380 RepID=UPI0033DC7734